MLFIIHTSENSISEISCHSEIENNIGFKSFGGNRIKKKDTGGGWGDSPLYVKPLCVPRKALYKWIIIIYKAHNNALFCMTDRIIDLLILLHTQTLQLPY